MRMRVRVELASPPKHARAPSSSGDFDWDGKPYLAVVDNPGHNTMSVLLSQ
jgi:hypothetical protein